MIVFDANVLIYSYNRSSPYHVRARAWTEQVFSGAEIAGIPWRSISAFLRVMTNPRLPQERFTPYQAAQIVDIWRAHPNVQILTPGAMYWEIFRRMVLEGQASGPLVSNAEIAALTIEYGGVLHTADRDFARFPGLRWVNPLELIRSPKSPA